jgi:aarF domain-containing kinase
LLLSGKAPAIKPKSRIRLRQERVAPSLSTLALRHDAYHFYCFGPCMTLDESQDSDSNENSASTMLACSSRAIESKGMAARLWEWLQQWWEYCRKIAHMTVRGTEIVVVMSPLAVLTPASIVSSRIFGSTVVSDASWWYVMKSVQHLGPAFVKLCQWIATRRDLFPPNVCDRLSRLHDKGAPHPWHYTQAQLVQAFGPDYESRGLVVHHDVIGCGSAAQVHRGTLTIKNGGDEVGGTPSAVVRPVAVKVLHPRFGPMVERDLQFLQTLAELVHSLPSDAVRMLNLPRAVQTFGTVLGRQADLRIEGRNLKQFRENFYGTDREKASAAASASAIVFPCPMEGWMDASVLVEELVQDAIPIAEYLRDASEAGQEIRNELASPLLRAFLKMVFIDNFIHSDLHPGNVLIQTSVVANDDWGSSGTSSRNTFRRRLQPLLGTKLLDEIWRPFTSETEPSAPQVRRTIVFLDAGIATTLSPDDQRNLHDLFRAVILNDGDRAGRIMVERAKYERCSQVPGGVEAFASGIRDLVSEFHDCRKQGLTLGAVRIGSLLSRVLDLCRVHGVEIDPSMASVVISTLVLEGLGRSLAPSLNLIDFAVPFILGRGKV